MANGWISTKLAQCLWLVAIASGVLPAVADEAVSQPLDQLMAQMKQAEKELRWQDAIAVAGKIIALKGKEAVDPWMWRSVIGELKLYDLQPEAAQKEFQRALAGPRKETGLIGEAAKARAAWGMARASAEHGDYKGALKWLESSLRDYPTRCGTCEESRAIRVHPIRAVWQAALLTDETRTVKLTGIIQGRFKPLKAQLVKGTEQSQMTAAAREARLVLGELLQRDEKLVEAQGHFRVVMKGDDERAKIAATRLARLGKREDSMHTAQAKVKKRTTPPATHEVEVIAGTKRTTIVVPR